MNWDLKLLRLEPIRVYNFLNKLKITTQDEVRNRNYPKALSSIKNFASWAYEFNQFYTDDMMEKALLTIEEELNVPKRPLCVDEKNVLFYDGFWNVDTRGLALIYLEALFELGFNVYYVTNEAAKGKKPATERLIKKHNGKIVYVTEGLNDNIGVFKAICKVFEYVEPKHAFLYIYPNDVSAVMAFNRYKDIVRRYQIDLTDHAFWLGINAFDFCYTGRKFGISVAYYERRIPKEKIVPGRYYPVVIEECEFQGFPFVKEEEDFVVFSGGSIYKTLDENKTYYKMVRRILDKFSQVKFWYAGNEIQEDMDELIRDYQGRVYFTNERKDLLPILQKVDMFLSTYPISGGLMYQYSAIAGKVPFTLLLDDSTKGVLLDDENLGIFFNTIDELIEDAERYINDPEYRKEKNGRLKDSVYSKERFTADLLELMKSGKTSLPLDIEICNTEKFKELYLYNFKKKYNM